MKITIVIASLGNDILDRTLFNLLKIEGLQLEIIVILPPNKSLLQKFKSQYLSSQQLSFYCSKTIGQVSQRSFGLNKANGDIVIQMDDDFIEVSKRSLQNVLQILVKIGKGNVVAPVFFDPETNLGYVRRLSGLLYFFNSLLYRILGAKFGANREGQLTCSALAFAIDSEYYSNETQEVQWLPGGFVACWKEDLILYDYFPFKGKAYSEDLIHSIMWTRASKRLFILPRIKVGVLNRRIKSSIKDLYGEFRVKNYIVRINKGCRLRLILWFLLSLIFRLMRKIKL